MDPLAPPDPGRDYDPRRRWWQSWSHSVRFGVSNFTYVFSLRSIPNFARERGLRCSLRRQGWRETMYRQFGNSAYRSEPAGQAHDHPSVVKSGQLDALVATVPVVWTASGEE